RGTPFRTHTSAHPHTQTSEAAGAGVVDFSRDIRPILSLKCYACHGQDPDARQAGLRLDLRAEALKSRGAGPAVVPGKPAQSRAWVRISQADPARRMPPPK